MSATDAKLDALIEQIKRLADGMGGTKGGGGKATTSVGGSPSLISSADVATADAYNAAQAKLQELIKNSASDNQKRLDNTKELHRLNDLRIKQMEKEGTFSKDEIELLKKKNTALKEQIDLLNMRVGAQDRVSSSIGGFVDKLTGANTAQTSFVKNLALGNGALSGLAELTGQVFSKMGLMNLGTAMVNAGFGILNQSYKLAIDMNKELAAAVKESSFVVSNDQVSSLQLAQRELVNYGILTKDLTRSFTTLKDYSSVAFQDIANGSGKSAEQMANTVAEFNRFGVSAQQSSKMIDTMVISLGQSGKAGKSVQTEMQNFAQTAINLGVSVKKMSGDFESAMPRLAAQGQNALEIFYKLEKQTKQLGTEFNTLMGVTAQFDEFESGAQAAGKLNAILGGDYINSIQMLNADEATRIELMREGLALSGQSWETMNKQMRQAYAAAIGISDMDQAAKLFGNTQNENNAINQKYEEVLKSTVTIGEKWDAVLQKFAVSLSVLLPVLEAFITALGWVGKISDIVSSFFQWFGVSEKLSNSIGNFVLALGLLAGGYVLIRMAIGGMISQVMGAASAVAGQLPVIGGAIESFAVSIGASIETAVFPMVAAVERLGQAATKNIGGLLALSVVIVAIGASVYFAAIGVAQLVTAFSGLNGAQITGAVIAIALFGITMVALLTTLSTMAPILAPGVAVLGMFALVVLAVGVAVWLAANGMATLVQSFASLKDVDMVSIGLGFVLIAAGIYALVGAGAMAILVIPALLGVGLAMRMMSYVMDPITKQFERLGQAALNIEKIPVAIDKMLASLKNYTAIAGNLKTLGKDLNDVTPISLAARMNKAAEAFSSLKFSGGEEFDKMAGALNGLTNALNTLPQEKLKLITMLGQVMKDTADAAKVFESVSTSKLATVFNELAASIIKLAEAFKQLPSDVKIGPVGNLLQTVNSVEPTKLETTSHLLKYAVDYNASAVASSGQEIKDATRQLISTASDMARRSDKGNAAAYEQTVELKIDGASFGKLIAKFSPSPLKNNVGSLTGGR